MRISQRAQAIAPFYAMEFGKQAAELEAAGHHVVKLSLGEPDFGAPPAVLAAMREAMDGRPMAYTAALGLPALRRAIARFYADRHGVEVDPARVAVTAGASAALVLGAAALVDPGDEVLIADPPTPATGRSWRASAPASPSSRRAPPPASSSTRRPYGRTGRRTPAGS